MVIVGANKSPDSSTQRVRVRTAFIINCTRLHERCVCCERGNAVFQDSSMLQDMVKCTGNINCEFCMHGNVKVVLVANYFRRCRRCLGLNTFLIKLFSSARRLLIVLRARHLTVNQNSRCEEEKKLRIYGFNYESHTAMPVPKGRYQQEGIHKSIVTKELETLCLASLSCLSRFLF